MHRKHKLCNKGREWIEIKVKTLYLIYKQRHWRIEGKGKGLTFLRTKSMCLRVSSQDIEWHQQRNVRYWLLISQYRVSSAAKSTRMISQWVNTQQVCHESRGSSGPLPSKCFLGTQSNSPLQLCHLEHRASRSPQQGRENRRVTRLLINALTEVTHINSASTHNSFTITSHMTLFNYVSIREFVGVCGYLENGVSAQFWLSYIII